MKYSNWYYFFLILLVSSSIVTSYASPPLTYQFDHAKSDTARLAACIKLIKYYRIARKPDSCLLYINCGLELIKKVKTTTYHADLYAICARFFNTNEQKQLGLYYLNKGRYWALKNNQTRIIGSIDYQFAMLYSDKALGSNNKLDFTNALRKIYENISFAKKHNLLQQEAYNYTLLVNFYQLHGNDSLAYLLLKKQIYLLDKDKNVDIHSSNIIHPKLETNYFFKNFAEADNNLQELDKIRAKSITYNYFTHLAIVMTLVKFGYFTKAIKVGSEVQEKPEVMSGMPGLDKSILFAYLSDAYLHERQYEQAKQDYLKSIAFADDFERESKTHISSYLSIELLKIRIGLSEHEGNLHEALVSSKKLATLKDSINANQRIFELAESQARFETQTKEDSLTQQIRLQKLENQYKGESLEQSEKIQWLSVLIIISLVFVILFIVIQSTKIKRQSFELKNLNETQNKLFGIISHDLRSPVASLQTFLGSINRTKNPERTAQVFSSLELQVDVVSNTLDNLLNWSINQMGGIKPKVKKINIQEIVEHILELSSPIIHYKSISIDSEIEDGYALADGNLTEIAFRNVLNNAIKFTPVNGTIRLSSRIENHEFILQIQDSGIGMTEAQLNNLFLNYSSQNGTIGEKGSGLGLKLSYELMAAQHGKIEIQSTPNTGTVVNLIFLAA